MLGSRTKHVVSYGRRSRRIVNRSEEENTQSQTRDAMQVLEPTLVGETQYGPSVNPIPPPHNSNQAKPSQRIPPLPPPRSPKPVTRKKGKLSPKAAKATRSISARKPLGSLAANVLAPSAALEGRHKRPSLEKGARLKLSLPLASVDIVVLDKHGKRLSQEKRQIRNDVQTNPNGKISAKLHQKYGRISDDTFNIDSDREDAIPVVRPSRGGRFRPIVVSSDEESDVKPPLPSSSKLSNVNTFHKASSSKRSKISQPTSEDEVSIPILEHIASQIPGNSAIIQPPVFSDHKNSTPIRTVRPIKPSRSYSPPSPSTSSELDDSLCADLAELELSPSTLKQLKVEFAAQTRIPGYLRPLLQECGQSTPCEFSAFIEMFPFDSIVYTSRNGAYAWTPGFTSQDIASFQKIGEASYSEVYGIGDIVLKIIPLRDEEARYVQDDGIDTPAPSDSKDVLKEIIVTRAMGEAHGGFVKLLRSYVVRGKYPSLLLDLWDKFHKLKGSESVRPDSFNVSQLYAIIALPNGGPDLEAFKFSAATKTGWKQACSLFWQVTRALAEAEDLVRFEHRDLHWGQILVKEIEFPETSTRHLNGAKIPMDHKVHGVRATIIDLGLARMDAHDGNTQEVYWTPFDEEIFEGEGDYQFDVYRMMRHHNENDWNTFRPLTNVMWLHYLVQKLLYAKGLRRPYQKRGTAPTAINTSFTERECYRCLVEVESKLTNVLAPWRSPQSGKECIPTRGRRKTQAMPKSTATDVLRTASDVLEFGVGKSWIK